MNKRYVVCAWRPWNVEMFNDRLSKTEFDLVLISDKKDLTLGALKQIDPEIVFFLDWSWIIKEDIIDNFMCVGFHSAPLPMCRGGSPIQNQIVRGIKDTALSAFVMDDGIDTGDILLQRSLNLRGDLQKIFSRICDLSFEMIIDIINKRYTRVKQCGESSYYKRRKPSDSQLNDVDFNRSLEYLYDFIRMLADPYPNSFLKLGTKKIIFKSAKMENDKVFVTAEVVEDCQ